MTELAARTQLTAIQRTRLNITADGPDGPRRDVRGMTSRQRFELVGGAAAAIALASLLFGWFAPLSGAIGWIAVAFLGFLGLYVLLVSLDADSQESTDRLATVLFASAGVLLFGALLFIVVYTLGRGAEVLTHPNFFVQTMEFSGPLDPLTVGGISHAIVGTLIQISIALAIAIPLGIGTAVFLNEVGGRFARFVRTVSDAMTALPSIVAGLFVYAAIIQGVTHERSGFAAGLAITVMMLPIIIRSADVVLRLVPKNLREASYALGTSRWRTVWHVVLPTARSGLVTSVILGTARGIGETSPVLLTSGITAAMNTNPLTGPMISLPLQVFDFVRSPEPTMVARGFGTAAVLLVLVLTLFMIARALGGRAPGDLSNRQRRATRAASVRDEQRFKARASGAVGPIVEGPPRACAGDGPSPTQQGVSMIRRPLAGILAAATAGLTMALTASMGAAPATAAGYFPISGTGSTWSQNALDQWRSNVAKNYAMTINYTGAGSTSGRRDFIDGTVDFAISEIPFQSRPEDGSAPEKPAHGYAYMPIVAGGTSFMYNLKISGKRVTNLRLSGDTITKMFTGGITNWNDAAIQADNPALAMPNKKIVPVIRSDGSGTTAQFTLWMSTQYPSIWRTGMTSQFPSFGNSKAQKGSDGVAGYVSQSYGEGAITYVEYSYAKKAGFPVAKVLNKSGYYIEPTAYSVAVAMSSAKINTDTSSTSYLTQILDGVYNSTDKRAYPLSSYSYAIVPTEVAGIFNTNKGNTLAAFMRYVLCEGQQQADTLGYSPLPMNLVIAGSDQIKRIPGSGGKGVDTAKCNNPTFKAGDSPSKNQLAIIAPQPAACDKKGTGQCSTGTAGATQTTPVTGTGTGGTSSGTPGTTGTTGTTSGTTSGTTGTPQYDENGNVVTGSTGTGEAATSTPFTLPDQGMGSSQWLMVASALLLVAAVVVPPLVSRRLRTGAGDAS